MAKSTPNKCSLASESKIGGAQLKYSVESGTKQSIEIDEKISKSLILSILIYHHLWANIINL
ncbi:hypothetical protein DERP_012579 [Dermatophagoides pteronyssinus]|uniref:Uncharacterized protein n=1 Tax=Dermatophagoides pteronyssinus TaxID=6956 RepID=A0ABQ8IUV1_DERPT|nr:hypothetical protein DERP_012579 [Dermatophagoides pteronyssinus]